MEELEITKTNRGFNDYGDSIIDTYGSKITVRQSSAAFVDRVWIFCNNDDPNYKNPSPHLNKAQVEALIKRLQLALEYMEDDED